MSLKPYPVKQVLSGQEITSWKSVTDEHISENIMDAKVDPELIDLEVDTIIGEQVIPAPESVRYRVRALQETNAQELIISFEVDLEYRSVATDHNLDQLIYSAFDTPPDRAAYVKKLEIEDIEDVLVEVEGFIPPQPESGGGLGIAVIAGASVGGAALLILCGLLLKRSRDGEGYEETQGRTGSLSSTDPGRKIAAEILVEPQDDVSTLGDPMFAPGGMLIGGLEKDEATASAGDNYEYAKQYRQGDVDNAPDRSRLLSEDNYTKTSSANSTTLSKLGRMSDSLFEDDASFEQQFAVPEQRFDVLAPAGKLGMVIDTPNGGAPVVHAIKDTSVLADRVRVGDRLMSVDGEDCTAMTAMQVSKLISLKSEKPTRVLLFARSIGK